MSLAFPLTDGFGVRIIVSEKCVLYDWSSCRSPSRARRRHKRGFPQRVKITPTSIEISASQVVMHPVIYDQLKRRMDYENRIAEMKGPFR